MKKLIRFLYIQPLPRVILYAILLIMLWGCIGKREKGKLWWKVFNTIAFFGIVMVIFYMTVCAREEGAREVVLIPFYSFYEAKVQPELYRSMLMNALLFVPIGLSLPFALPRKQVVVTIAAAFLISAGVETIQYCLGLGRCEVDDVIMNTLGAVIGALAYIISSIV